MRSLHMAFRAELLRNLEDSHLTRTEAARRLGVSRQAFQAYITDREGSVPRKEVLRRIVEIWPDFRVVAGGKVFDKDVLSPTAPGGPTPVPLQLNLFEILKELRRESLDIDVKSVDEGTRLSITIRIPA
jgi:hypothetical protein